MAIMAHTASRRPRAGVGAGLRVHATVMLREPYPRALARAASYTFPTHAAGVRTTGTLESAGSLLTAHGVCGRSWV